MKWIWPMLVLACSFAFAQSAAPVVGAAQVPDYIWTLASVVIGWLVKEVASPLTTLLKKRLGFQGDTTRYVYIVLSTAFVLGFGLFSHAFGSGSAGWWAALGAYATAIIKGFGDYQKQIDAAKAGQAVQMGTASDLPAGYAPATYADLQNVPAPTGLEDLK